MAHFLHSHLVAALGVCYALAALFPLAGIALRDLKLGTLPGTGGALPIAAPMVLLSLLLVNSALGTSASDLRHTLKNPFLILAGIALNSAVPVVFALLAASSLHAWHDPEEVQLLLTGIALVGSMPIAGSSTAWAQKGGGNVALSLGLVLGSTAVGPLLTPLVLHVVSGILQGDHAERLRALAYHGGGPFLLVSVVLPSAFGFALRAVLGAARVAKIRPTLQFISLVDLLVLNYSNASTAMPRMLAQPNYKFLALILVASVLLCVFAFWAGAVLGKLLRLRKDDRIALMFGLGMNNNGGGLVLASVALSSLPLVQLPLLAYNLVQHLVAAAVEAMMRRERQAARIAVRTPALLTQPKILLPNQELSRSVLDGLPMRPRSGPATSTGAATSGAPSPEAAAASLPQPPAHRPPRLLN